MHILSSVAELRAWRVRQAEQGATSVALVPTMGNLHDGHLSLIALGREHASEVVASIFVNRLQFGAGEDFDRYPRTFEADCAALEAAGCAAVFAPHESDLYPVPQQYTVTPPPLAEQLCGRFRPGHFSGVCTVVLKLFNLVQPQVAIFGKKDYQQLAMIRGMVQQFNLDIRLVGAATGRAPDGLALSSRNGYLSPEERAEAPRLVQQLRAMALALQQGATDFTQLEQAATDHLHQHGWRVDYVSIRDAATLEVPSDRSKPLVLLAAAHLGRTRLIDNLELDDFTG